LLNRRFRKVLSRPHCSFKNSFYLKIKEPKEANGFSIGLLSLSGCLVKNAQTDAIKKLIKRFIKKRGTLSFFLKIPFLAKTAKPTEIRMGKGKGKISFYVFPTKQNSLLIRFLSKAKKNKLVYHKALVLALIKRTTRMFSIKNTFFNFRDFNS